MTKLQGFSVACFHITFAGSVILSRFCCIHIPVRRFVMKCVWWAYAYIKLWHELDAKWVFGMGRGHSPLPGLQLNWQTNLYSFQLFLSLEPREPNFITVLMVLSFICIPLYILVIVAPSDAQLKSYKQLFPWQSTPLGFINPLQTSSPTNSVNKFIVILQIDMNAEILELVHCSNTDLAWSLQP